ncbi:hypothetical protein BDY24DRAFT_420470 [Mrakia frigida]|uniref:uncharacterized protein n=1 Tax=Mrakia frigida TaxID=29902 RepID=UPI003FCBFDAE
MVSLFASVDDFSIPLFSFLSLIPGLPVNAAEVELGSVVQAVSDSLGQIRAGDTERAEGGEENNPAPYLPHNNSAFAPATVYGKHFINDPTVGKEMRTFLTTKNWSSHQELVDACADRPYATFAFLGAQKRRQHQACQLAMYGTPGEHRLTLPELCANKDYVYFDITIQGGIGRIALHRIAAAVSPTLYSTSSNKIEVSHGCGHRRCINPLHTYMETSKENKGRIGCIQWVECGHCGLPREFCEHDPVCTQWAGTRGVCECY